MNKVYIAGGCEYNNSISHHGIKGQKWGIRHYQNQDGSLTDEGRKHYSKIVNKMANNVIERSYFTQERSIPKGTKMYRVSVNKNEQKKGGPIYVSYTDVDRNHYKGGWVRQNSHGARTYEYEFTLNKDLKIPSREKQEKVVNEVLKNKKNLINTSFESYLNIVSPWLLKSSIKEFKEKYKDDKDVIEELDKERKANFDYWKTQDANLMTFMVLGNLGLTPKLKNEVCNRLAKEGYNAMTDEASVSGRNNFLKEGYDSLIIFDDRLLDNNKVKKISNFAENRANKKYINWRTKAIRKSNKNEISWHDSTGSVVGRRISK